MNEQTNLKKFGWSNFFEKQIEDYNLNGLKPARVTVQNRNNYLLISEFGELTGELSGKFLYEIECSDAYENFPVTGDWVEVRVYLDEGKAIMEKLLTRKTKFSRKESGVNISEQVIAANIDKLFVLTSLNDEYKLKRLHRYDALAKAGKIKPVYILTKSDLSGAERIAESIQVVKSELSTEDVIAINVNDDSWKQVLDFISTGETAVMTGSSGVGKSTLLNKLLGKEIIATGEVSEYKDRGKHTTTKRELFVLPTGGCIIDTPGLREIGLWSESGELGESFKDIKELINNCRFSDCSHKSEPGCALVEALENGLLDEDYYSSYLKLQREVEYYARKSDESKMRQEREMWKKRSKDAKKISKLKKGF